MIPWSRGWRREVVFGGKNTNSTFESSRSGWHVALSRKTMTFLCCRCIFSLNSCIHSLKRPDITQAFLFDLQMTGRLCLSRLRKQRGLADFPMISVFWNSPTMLTRKAAIKRSYDCLTPLHSVPLTRSVLSGIAVKHPTLVEIKDVFVVVSRYYRRYALGPVVD